MSKTVVQVVGEARSGKSRVCEYLSEEYDFTTVLISNFIRDYAKHKKIKLMRRSDYLDAHRKMKLELGMGIIKDKVLDRPDYLIAVDGNRVPNDVRRIRDAAAQCIVIALECPTLIRFSRSQKLATDIDPKTFEDFIEDDNLDAFNEDPEQQNTTTVMNEADFHIDSSGPLEVLYSDVDEIIIPLLENPASFSRA